jgi:hypothetical protein
VTYNTFFYWKATAFMVANKNIAQALLTFAKKQPAQAPNMPCNKRIPWVW